MKKLRWLAGVASAVVVIAGLAATGLSPVTVSSQAADPTLVTNTSGRALPVLEGSTGQPVSFGGQPWQIQPGESFYTHNWNNASRFVFAGRSYHYIGSVGGSNFRFFLVEDWLVNSGQATPPPVVTPTATSVPATPTPTTPFVHLGTSYLPNCGLTQVRGKIVNPDGIGRSGVQVRVSSGDWSAVSNPTDGNGNWDVLLDSKPKEGTWTVQVWDGSPQSPAITVQTNTADCGPNGTGQQVAVVDFKKVTY